VKSTDVVYSTPVDPELGDNIMDDKVMIVFVQDKADNYHPDVGWKQCLVSPRDTKNLRQGVNITYKRVSHLDQVKQRPWPKNFDMNIDDELKWLRANINIIDRMLFINCSPEKKLIWLKEHASEQLINLAIENEITHSRIRNYQPHGKAHHPVPLDAFIIKPSSDIFHKILNTIWWELVGSIFICIEGKNEAINDISIKPGFDLSSVAFVPMSIDDLFFSGTEKIFDWQYTIQVDYAPFDAPDPIYWVKQSCISEFIHWIKETAHLAGYNVHILPWSEAMIWNWIAFGEIPVLSNGNNSSI